MNCIQGTKSIFHQISNLLKNVDEPAYVQPLVLFDGATLGQHFRHIFDFYHCLIRGVEKGIIDYSDRERDPAIEQDPHQALRAFEGIGPMLDGMKESILVQVRADFSDWGNAPRPILSSSIGRELMFAHDHALHHLAIIRIGLQTAFPHLGFPKNLGLSPATVKHRKGGVVSGE